MSRPKIVALDGYALNPGDLSWNRLEELGDCTVYDRTTPDAVASRALGAEIVLTNKALISGETISALPELRYIGVLATGYNVVDVAAASKQGIVVTNVPTYSTDSVAQMVFAHLLNLTQRIGDHAAAVRNDKWAAAEDWCFWDTPLIELSGLTIDIVGFGQIGREVAKLSHAFGMNIIVATRSIEEMPGYVRAVTLDAIFVESDVISLHCQLTPETERLVNTARIGRMERTAFLINSGHGGLVDETALAHALNTERIAGAGLDVLLREPPPAEHPLTRAKNCFVTLHIAWATKSSRSRLLETAVKNLVAFFAGDPQHQLTACPSNE
ncbi:D-2-hydroxyacid dehydrogenase [Adhaeretor mobilis]|uniref:Glycerate dehydrogenase n=1 Tax=Adhaeretor mobilis TaxID=1930276 RepID=A0A517MVC0_9BACT|nr:D-2-hydroxyacid dehydrogenase [Adhaeretor mobilis]QDS98831.1 Glycerate dehydrogenase [Adhaeretor mobilis]